MGKASRANDWIAWGPLLERRGARFRLTAAGHVYVDGLASRIDPERCALEECEEIFWPNRSGFVKKYCSPKHQALAAKRRYLASRSPAGATP